MSQETEPIRTRIQALQCLLTAQSTADVENAVQAIDYEEGTQWLPVGANEGNASVILASGDPQNSFIERVTNAIDATIELAADKNPELKTYRDPRRFVEDAFDVKTGYLTSLRRKNRERLADDLGITVTVRTGDAPETPTLEVRDYGIGLAASEFPATILSLHKRNKINKWYVMGVYGQGGSTTYRFSDYTIIASRKARPKADDSLAITVVRFQEPGPDERGGMYVYLADENGLPFTLSDTNGFESGTVVRHINYALGRPGIFVDFYGDLEARLFDPVLPFNLVLNLGTKYDGRRRLYGSRNRLQRSDLVESSDEHVARLGMDGSYGSARIRYWLLKAGTEAKTKGTFVDPNHSVVVTYLGQTHATVSKHILNQSCKLPYVYADLIVQIDLDGLSDLGRRRMFTSTREHLTVEGRKMLEDVLVAVLREDAGLRDKDAERQRQFLARGTSKQRIEMRRRLAEMINRIRPGTFDVGTRGKGSTPRPATVGASKQTQRAPLETRDFPTFVRIATPGDPLRFTKGRHRRIEIESDAPDGFLSDSRYHAEVETDASTSAHVDLLARTADFRGGRLSLTTEVVETALVDQEFDFRVRLRATQPGVGELTLTDSQTAIVRNPPRSGRGSDTAIDAPNIIEVGPEVHDAAGVRFWEQNEWTPDHVAEVKERDDGVDIFVSVANKYLHLTLSQSGYSAAHQDVLRSRYVLLAAFHAFIQEQAIKDLQDQGPASDVDHLRMYELDRAARTILVSLTSERAFSETA